MRELLNVLYVMTQGAMLHLDHDTVRVEIEHEVRLRAPLMRLSGIVAIGQVSLSSFLIQRCAEDGRAIVWLDRRGRFKARVEGPTRGNVLLRRSQHLALSDPARVLRISRQIVAGKIQNTRSILLRAARDSDIAEDREALRDAATKLAEMLSRVASVGDLDILRGTEGEAARAYFGVFDRMVRVDRPTMAPSGRSRRPPRDRANAILSFLYALVRAECAAAVEGAGLDAQVGYLHALRPGRPALALDLMEELRSIVADRLTLALINRRQLRPEHFESLPGGAVHLNDDGRKAVVVAFQKRKEEEVEHRVLKEKVPIGLVPHVQARLLARHLRGDLEDYPPFVAQ